MHSRRVDPLTGHEVLVAPGRRKIGAARPAGLPEPTARCPFCPGHEADTETTLLALGEPWQVRVVANRFPLVVGDEGAHEVVIEHREHDRDLSDYDAAHAATMLDAVQQRINVLERAHLEVQYFRNRGRRAGSSQPHPHGQLVALPQATPTALRRAEQALDPQNRLAEVLVREAEFAVAAEGPWVAWCPPASERSFHVRVAPREGWPRFTAVPAQGLASLGALLPRLTRAAIEVSGSGDYNLLLRDPPLGTDQASFFFDLFIRTGGDAGFELGSGISVCTVEPLEAARAMRLALDAPDGDRAVE